MLSNEIQKHVHSLLLPNNGLGNSEIETILCVCVCVSLPTGQYLEKIACDTTPLTSFQASKETSQHSPYKSTHTHI